jgi:hypothetical protein
VSHQLLAEGMLLEVLIHHDISTCNIVQAGAAASSMYHKHSCVPPVICTLLVVFRWLGEWLLARVPADGEGAESSPPAPTRSFEELSRQEKVGLAFRYLDRDSSG